MPGKVHALKTWPSFFEAIVSGEKTFEVRRNDRDFAVGDELILREYDPTPNPYGPKGCTGRIISARVTYVLRGGSFGIDEHFVVMGIKTLGEVR